MHSAASPSPRPLPLGIRVKWIAFRMLESAANSVASIRSRRRRKSAFASSRRSPAGERGWTWLYASTVGELNAIEPFVAQYLKCVPARGLLLLSDHEHYEDAFLSRYPAADFFHLSGSSADVRQAVRAFPPKALVIAEMPCMLSDAPGRFPFAVVYYLKQRGVPACLVNGWLYRSTPASRIDSIEKRLFNRAYLGLVDLFLVQNEAIRTELITSGAIAERVVTTGNIKFDAMDRTGWSLQRAKDPDILAAIAETGRPCIVAGCVTNLPDQEAILDAFGITLAAVPETLLVIAPRHPEVGERMSKLDAFIRERKLRYAFKTKLVGGRFDPLAQVLVLDTIGELNDFYALASLTYVGPNHNVLEPLAFNKPVFVMPGWEPGYPSFPVYRFLLSQEAIIQVGGARELAEAWIKFLLDPDSRRDQQTRIKSVLTQECGATKRALEALVRHGFAPAMPPKSDPRGDANSATNAIVCTRE